MEELEICNVFLYENDDTISAELNRKMSKIIAASEEQLNGINN